MFELLTARKQHQQIHFKVKSAFLMLALLLAGIWRIIRMISEFFGWKSNENQNLENGQVSEKFPSSSAEKQEWKIMKASKQTKLRLPFKLLELFPLKSLFILGANSGLEKKMSALPFVRSMLQIRNVRVQPVSV
jgi:hypothetical protein